MSREVVGKIVAIYRKENLPCRKIKKPNGRSCQSPTDHILAWSRTMQRTPTPRSRRLDPLRPPEGAPNVLVILLDDVGFGASSAFGGPCSTPTAERLAEGGLKYNRFHTTALCAPT